MAIPVAPPGPKVAYTLTVSDRCDVRGCGSRAYVRAIVTLGSDLLWCCHHAREIEAALRPRSIGWVDETGAVLG